jgi:hypothetical protein
MQISLWDYADVMASGRLIAANIAKLPEVLQKT